MLFRESRTISNLVSQNVLTFLTIHQELCIKTIMLCSKSSIAIILATASCVMAFQPAMSKIWSRASSLRDTTPVTETETQTVQDLNLEEMFEVFDKADKTVSSSEIPKGLAGSKFEASKVMLWRIIVFLGIEM